MWLRRRWPLVNRGLLAPGLLVLWLLGLGLLFPVTAIGGLPLGTETVIAQTVPALWHLSHRPSARLTSRSHRSLYMRHRLHAERRCWRGRCEDMTFAERIMSILVGILMSAAPCKLRLLGRKPLLSNRHGFYKSDRTHFLVASLRRISCLVLATLL